MTGGSLIDEIVRDGARRMLAAALEAEVAAYIAAHAGQLDADGRRLVVRNGHAVPRQVLTSCGAVEVAAPRVNDKRVDEAGKRRRSRPGGARSTHRISSRSYAPAPASTRAASSNDPAPPPSPRPQPDEPATHPHADATLGADSRPVAGRYRDADLPAL
jgi:hypothetical protein